MTKERKALKLALEKFEFMNHVDSIFEGEFDFQINAIKEALAQPEQEPVAWMYEVNNAHTCLDLFEPPDDAYDEGTLHPLYTTPPQRTQPEPEPVVCVEYIPCCTDQTCPKCKAAIKPELVCVCGAVWEGQELIYTTPQRTWSGLTADEIESLYQQATYMDDTDHIHMLMMAEAKLKEKNSNL